MFDMSGGKAKSAVASAATRRGNSANANDRDDAVRESAAVQANGE